MKHLMKIEMTEKLGAPLGIPLCTCLGFSPKVSAWPSRLSMILPVGWDFSPVHSRVLLASPGSKNKKASRKSNANEIHAAGRLSNSHGHHVLGTQ